MITFPHAKINIGLKVLRRRDDGYHDIETLMVPVRWNDALELLPSPITKITVEGAVLDIPDEENLCIKAWKLINRYHDIGAVHFVLLKNIPVGSGLGGGSSDGAFALRMLEEYFGLNLGPGKLKSYAAELGSDCAFFTMEGPAAAQGRGDLLTPSSIDLSGFRILIVCPGIHISTAEVYQAVKPAESPGGDPAGLPVSVWKDQIVNDLEKVVFPKFPVIGKIKEDLYNAGAVYASMSGSGSAVFGLFSSDAVLPAGRFGGMKVLEV